MSELTKIAALAVAIALATQVPAGDKKPDDKKAEKVDNPEYANWQKFKPGTTLVMKLSLEAGGMTYDSFTTTKLVEVKDDALVLEAEGVLKAPGGDTKLPAEKRDVPKQYDSSKLPPGFDPKPLKPEGVVDEGKKKVKVGGTEYACKWYKFEHKAKDIDGEGSEGEMWLSDDVPGGIMKIVSKTKGETTTFEATEITVKK